MGSIGKAQRFTTLPSTNIKPLRPTKRAEEVFTREYTRLRLLAKNAIEDNNFNVGGYSNLHSDDNEPVFSRRMLQGVQAKINSEFHGLELDAKLGVGDEESRLVRRYALSMLQRMVNKYYKSMYEED